ncbi:unnamed protein product [Clonostachys byssicola]|uniref:Uncharacterized protein n=1 Tax=Clonostachys byssicola TaxID=160290 RepID=A0A9N9UV97_9HYPO|nr:unnamed protein product [Clonostachys byssicola]
MEDCYRQHMEDRDHVAEFSTSLCEDIFDLTSLFSTTQTDQSGLPFDNSTLAGKKRPRGSDDGDVEAPQGYFGENEDLEAFRLLVPELFPHCPSLDNRRPVNFIENPFFEDHLAIVERHPHLRPTSQMNTGVVINGYLKFVLILQNGLDTLAICGGRTLLPKTNAWLDLGSVIDSHECARHAALAFSAGYMLDYIPSERLRIRANFHYKRASELLALALNDLNIYQVGKEDGVITALHLLWSDDIVQWELREPKTVRPRWRRGTRTATAILDATDPGYRYWKPENVQITSIRRSNANMCAYAEICALPVTRLFVTEIDKLYPWLLEGSEEDVRQIHGGTGVSPKVLHIYAQITQLSARIAELPDSPILPHAADALMRRLENFRQTSELSRGHETTAQLLESCILDERGLVHCATKVTELTAETWVQAAKIYLCCRFFRSVHTFIISPCSPHRTR